MIQQIESNLWDYFIEQEALFINLQDDIRFQLDPSIDTIDKSTLVIAPIHTNNQEDQLAHHLYPIHPEMPCQHSPQRHLMPLLPLLHHQPHLH